MADLDLVYLMGEPLEKFRKFQAHVVRLAMKAGIWVARCRMIYTSGTESVSSRKAAADEYVATILRTGWKDLPITKCRYMGLPARKRWGVLLQWEVAHPTPTRGPLYACTVRAPKPAAPSEQEIRAKRKSQGDRAEDIHPGCRARTPPDPARNIEEKKARWGARGHHEPSGLKGLGG